MTKKRKTDVDRLILLPASMDGVNPLKDGSLSMRFHTQELSVEDKVIIMEFLPSQGYLMYKENKIKAEEIPEYDAEFDEFKTPSQQFRAILFRLWEATGQEQDFLTYYRRLMERLTQHYKDKIPKNYDQN